jgi:hypothetical protein
MLYYLGNSLTCYTGSKQKRPLLTFSASADWFALIRIGILACKEMPAKNGYRMRVDIDSHFLFSIMRV